MGSFQDLVDYVEALSLTTSSGNDELRWLEAFASVEEPKYEHSSQWVTLHSGGGCGASWIRTLLRMRRRRRRSRSGRRGSTPSTYRYLGAP